LKHQFPAHPSFEDETNLGPATLKRVLAELERASQTPDGRIAVDQPKRKEMRQIANPLALGEMHETHFLLGQYWRTHFLRKHAEDGGAMTVGKMRRWIDEPAPRGLSPKEVQNLIILVFGLQTNRSFFLHGGPIQPSLENIADELELREQRLPSQATWEKVRVRADAIFGVPTSPLLNASNVSKLIGDIQALIATGKDSCGQLLIRLKQIAPQLASVGTTPARIGTAQAVKALVDALAEIQGDAFLNALAAGEVASTEQAMGTSFKKAGDVLESLARVNWELLEAVLRLTDERGQAAQGIWTALRQAFQTDELAVALGPALTEAQSRAVKLLADVPKPQPRPQPEGGKPPDNIVTQEAPRPAGGAQPGGEASQKKVSKFSHLENDEAEVATFYGDNAEGFKRNRQLVEELKRAYGSSQVLGDSVPEMLPADKVRAVLEVHHIKPLSKGGADARSNMIVVSATLHTLIHADEKCAIDLASSEMTLFGARVPLKVDPAHNG
jgi:hypothetical protein